MKENPDTNRNASNERIDELLNSYIDNELTTEQQAEVEQMIAQDAKTAQRLRQFQKCKMLVGSMPFAEAPASVLEGVKASLAGITLSSDVQPAYKQQAGSRHILIRKVLAAAAIIAIAAGISAVINSSISRRSTPASSPALTVASSIFSGRLELKTSSLNAVDAVIKSAIDDNGLSASISPDNRWQSRRVYTLSCTREGLKSLLADLDNIWSELDSATLYVNTEIFGNQTVVNAVTTKQIAQIAGQDKTERRIELAKDFAVLNNIAESLPDKEIRAAIESGNSKLNAQWRMLKPVLTGNKTATKKPTQPVEEKQLVSLTIILDW